MKGGDGMILGIDPGNIESAYALLDADLKPVEFGKINNEELLKIIYNRVDIIWPKINPAIEMIASYGMAVGETTFETCVWIGRFTEALASKGYTVTKIYRKHDVCMNLCYSTKAKDSNVRQALIDRFGVVGTKNNKGWFFGVSKDVWSAIAVGVTLHDKYINKGETNVE